MVGQVESLDALFDSTLDVVSGEPDYARSIMRWQRGFPVGTPLTLLVRDLTADEIGKNQTQYVFQSTVDAIRPMHWLGSAVSDQDCAYSRFHWLTDVPGIQVHFPGSYGPDPNASSLLSISGIGVRGRGWTEMQSPAIIAYNRVIIERCLIDEWGAGIQIISNPTSTLNTNADKFRLYRLGLTDIAGTGLYFRGPDSQAGSIVECALDFCARADQTLGKSPYVDDESFLGNTFDRVVVHLAHTGEMPFQRLVPNGSSRFRDCYVDGSLPSRIMKPSIIDGGFMSLTPDSTGSMIQAQQNGVSIRPVLAQPNDADPTDIVEVFIPDRTGQTAKTLAAFSSTREQQDAPGAFWTVRRSAAFAGWYGLHYGASPSPSDAVFLFADASAQHDPVRFAKGSFYVPGQRLFVGPQTNSIEWASSPPPMIGHQDGDIVISTVAGQTGWKLTSGVWTPF